MNEKWESLYQGATREVVCGKVKRAGWSCANCPKQDRRLLSHLHFILFLITVILFPQMLVKFKMSHLSGSLSSHGRCFSRVSVLLFLSHFPLFSSFVTIIKTYCKHFLLQKLFQHCIQCVFYPSGSHSFYMSASHLLGPLLVPSASFSQTSTLSPALLPLTHWTPTWIPQRLWSLQGQKCCLCVFYWVLATKKKSLIVGNMNWMN